MPYRVTHDGRIECDSLDEAVGLAERLASNGSAKPEKTDKKPTESAYAEFWQDLEIKGKNAVRYLASMVSEPVWGEKLAEALSITTVDLPGLLVHIRGAAARHGIKDPVARTKKTVNGKIKSRYSINKRLAEGLRNELKE